MPPPLLEPVSTGIIVYLLNKYVVSKLNFCYPCELVQTVEHHEDDVSSTNTTISDTTEVDSVVHTHAHIVHVS